MSRKAVKQLIRRLSANKYQTLNRIELDSQRLLCNVNYIRQRHLDHAIIPVLKANAYGHGLVQVAQILNNAECAFLAVDGYFEAAQVRHVTRHRILVMSYIKSENVKFLDVKHCSFVVQDVATLHAFGTLNQLVRIHLELNTGMFRLGLQPEEIDEYLAVLRSYPKLQLEGVMSHLADADNEKDDAFTSEQSRLFDQAMAHLLKEGFEPKYFHLAQTAGSTKVHSRYANALRLGIGLYGINPLKPADKHYSDLVKLQPVLQLKSTIIKTYYLKKGNKVSYNGMFTAPEDMRIGVLPLGYYEGLPSELSNKGCVMSNDQQLAILGRVCMNHTVIDITGTELGVGDEVIVISNNSSLPNSVQHASAAYGLIAYEWLVRLSSSIRRGIV